MMVDADNLANRHQLELGLPAGWVLIEPVVRPLGFDWKIGIGIISSFAAREAVVSTLAIVYGMGADAAEDGSNAPYERMQAVRRPDGSPVFTMATCISLFGFLRLGDAAPADAGGDQAGDEQLALAASARLHDSVWPTAHRFWPTTWCNCFSEPLET